MNTHALLLPASHAGHPSNQNTYLLGGADQILRVLPVHVVGAIQ